MTQLQTELREWEEKKASAIASHRTAVTRLLLWACVLEVIFIVWYTVPPPAPIFLLLPRSSQSAGWLRPGRRTPQLLSPLRLVLEPHLRLRALHCRYYFCTSPTDVLDHATYIAPALLIPILYVPLPTTYRHPGLISYVSRYVPAHSHLGSLCSGYVAKRLISWIYNTRICKAGTCGCG